MQSVWAFLSAHAVLVLLAWPILSALVNLAFGAADKYAATHPRVHAVLSLIESAGFDARGTLSAIAKLLAGKGISVGAKKAGAVVFVLLGLGALASQQSACTPAEQQQVAKIAPEAAACVFAIVEDVTVAPDIAKTIATCGVTAQDVYSLVAELLAKQSDAGPDGAVGASPDRAHLEAWLAAAKAAGAK